MRRAGRNSEDYWFAMSRTNLAGGLRIWRQVYVLARLWFQAFPQNCLHVTSSSAMKQDFRRNYRYQAQINFDRVTLRRPDALAICTDREALFITFAHYAIQIVASHLCASCCGASDQGVDADPTGRVKFQPCRFRLMAQNEA